VEKQYSGWYPTVGSNTPFYRDTVPLEWAITDFQYEVAVWKAEEEALDTWGLPLTWEIATPVDEEETAGTW
jgi:hypothetical protein